MNEYEQRQFWENKSCPGAIGGVSCVYIGDLNGFKRYEIDFSTELPKDNEIIQTIQVTLSRSSDFWNELLTAPVHKELNQILQENKITHDNGKV